MQRFYDFRPTRGGGPRPLGWLLPLALLLLLLLGSIVRSYGQTLPVTSGLYRHFKADAGVSTDASGNVTVWADQSPNAAGAIQSGSAQRPALVATGLGGRPTLRFDGVDDLMTLSSNVDLTSGGLSVFVVGRVASRKNYNGMFRVGSTLSTLNSGLEFYWQQGSGGSGTLDYVANRNAAAERYQETVNAGPTAPAPFIAAAAMTATTSRGLAVNGTTASMPGGGGSFLPSSSNSAWIGTGYGGGTPYLQGDISELIIYNREVTAAEQTQIETYLSNKYGIATAANPSPVSSPAPVTSGLQLHLAADLGVTGGSTVSGWADQSGNGFHVAQPTASLQPALAANAVNGKPALALDGNDDRLPSAASVDLLGGQTNYTFFAVAKPGATQKAYADIFDYNHSGGVRFVVQQDNTATNAFYNNAASTTDQTLPSTAFSIYGGTFVNGGTATSRLNGGNPLSGAATTNTFGTPSTFTVGAWTTGGREFNGQLAEILVYNRVLTATEIGQVESYLATKYAIALPSSAPTIVSFSPATGAAGTTVTITGTNLDQVTGVQIGGATATSVAVVSGSGNTQLTAVVGTGAQTGRVVLNYSGGSAISATDFVVPLPTLARVEYFVDADPGFGAGTAFMLPATPAADLGSLSATVPLSSLGAGFHALGVRSRDANGQWSLTNRRTFYYEPTASNSLANLIKLEYFIDTDPGFAAATDVPIMAGADVSGVAFNVSLGSLSAGFHQLGVRSRDANGQWSLTNRRAFYYEPMAANTLANITKVEYFIDAEPGFGTGIDVPVTAATDISGLAFGVNLGSTAAGFHTLSVRSRDANGQWSLTSVRSFYYEPALAAAPNVNKIEYYFDNDPGFGSATDVPVPTPAPDLANFSFAADASALADGAHRIFCRSRDANGKWSLVSSRSFVKNGCASSANLTAGLPTGNYGQSSSYQGSAESAFNGTATWIAPGFSGTIQADMTTGRRVTEVRYSVPARPSTTATFQIQTSPDMSTWTTVDTYNTTLATSTVSVVRTLATAQSNVRGLRINVAFGSEWVSLQNVGAYDFNCANPSITSFTPAGGGPGTVVTLVGTNLSGATAVTFNGAPALLSTVTGNTSTGLTVTAPVGGSTGLICVTTPGGTACSASNYTYPPTIATGTVSAMAFCASTLIQVPFTTNMAGYNSGNQFSFQLSDANGVFTANSKLYGLLFNSNATGGVLRDTVAFRTPAGSGYRVRVVASNPNIIGTDNGTNLTIYPTPAALATSNSPVVYNGTIQLAAQPTGQSTYQWYVNYTSGGTAFVGSGQTLNLANAQPTQSGKYFVFITNANGCPDSASVRVLVQPNAVPVLTMSPFTFNGCAGVTFNVGFSVTGNNFLNGNTISAQLSDASGSFASPTVIGSAAFTGQGGGAISATVPQGTPAGSGYRIRLVGSNPSVTSTTDNGANLTVPTTLVATASSNSPIVSGGTLQLNAGPNGAASYQWYVNYTGGGTAFISNQQNPTFNNVTTNSSGFYYVFVTQGGCTDSASVRVLVNPPATATLATTGFSGSFCPGSTLSVAFTASGFSSGNVFTAQLSDASGSFAAPVNIGSLSATSSSSSISATVPLNAAAGTGYRIRVVASTPATIGSDNGSNLTIGTLTYAWTGGVSTDWFDGRNWSCGQVPTATSVVTIPGGASFYPVVKGSTAAQALNLTIASGATFTNNGIFNLYGNVTVSGTVQANTTSVWSFMGSGSQFILGGNPLQVGNLFINAGSVLTMNTGLNVYSNWYNNGGFVGGVGYAVLFNGAGGTQLIGGSSVTSFYNVGVNSGAVVNLAINTIVLGNVTATGIFNAVGYGVAFNGNAAQTIGGSGATFYTVTINNTVGVTLVSNITVLGDWINNGLFSGGTYSVTFAGTVAQIIGGTQVTNFYNVTFNNLISVTLHQNIYVLGGFVNTGVFYGWYLSGGSTLGYFVRFGGTAAQVITANVTTYFYHFYADNAAGVSLATNIYIAGNYYLYSGTFSPSTYTVYFNGNEGPGVVQTVGGYTALSFYTWGIATGAYVRLIQNVTLLGSFGNLGTFYGYNLVGGVYTGYTFTFGGSGAQSLTGGGVYEFWHVTWNNLAGITLNQNISVWGNWLNNGGYIANGYLVNFMGNVAQTIGGPVLTTFHHVTITNAVSVSLLQPITVLGNWAGGGVFLGNGYLVYFNGTAAQTITAGLNTRFFDLRFNNPTSVTLLSNIYLNGNWTHDGGFVANGFRVFFSGSTLQTIAGTVLTTFHHLTISTNASVQLARAITLLGDWTNDGSFAAGTYTVTFGGTVAQLIGGTAVTNFYGLTMSNPVSVTLAQHIYVLGGFLNTGVFYGYQVLGGVTTGYFVRFAGTVAQVVNANATTYFYHFYADNAAGVSLLANVYIAGNYYLYSGSFNPGTYTVFFNGNEGPGVVQTVGGYTGLSFYNWNIGSAASVRLLQNVTLLGNFANAGTFYGYNLVGGTYTGYTFAFAGTVAQALSGAGVFDFWHLTWNNLAGVTLNRDISLRGNWLHLGGFLANGYRVTFGGSALQLIGGTVATVFHHFTIATGATVRQDLGITLLGDWTNNGSFLPNALLVYFSGTALQTIAGTALTTFYDVTFNNAVNVSLGHDIDVTRHFVNQGGYCGCGFRTRFNGTVAQTITCTSGRTHFHDLTFANAAGVTLLDGIYVSGLWVNNGGYLANDQTVIFDGTALQTIGGTVLSAFYNVGITNAVDVQLLRDITVAGFWNNTGLFHGQGFGVTFNGVALQTITTTGSAARSYFHHITWANGVGCVLAGDVYVAGNWLCNGPFNPATYTVYFNGTVAQTCGGTQPLRFFGLNCSNPSGVTYSGPVYLLGNFVNTGLVNCGAFGWYCIGTAPQTIGGVSATPTRFYDLFIQNGTGVTATDNWFLTHLLTLTTGNLASNGHLTLTSNASGSALVVNPVGGGVVTGVATMERFITGLSGAPGYRHYASPMKLSAGAISTTVQEFADDLPVFELNPAYNTAGNTATPFPTFFEYDETRLTASKPGFDDGWRVPLATDNLLPLRGYTAQTLPTTTVDISGELNTGPVSYALGRGSLANSGWHLLGNPYPAPIDWDVVRSTSGMLTGVADALYVFQPSGQYTGTYQSYVNGLGQNGGTKDLAAMQGFFVRATAPTASVSLTNAVRATSYLSPVFNRGTAVRPVLRLEARNLATATADETVVYFEPGAALGFSAQHDAYKVQLNGNGRPSLWSQAGAESFAINGLPDLATAPVVPLGVRVSQDGAHELTLTALADAPAGTQVWLEDRVLNRRQNLAASPTYAFSMLASFSGPRFYLNFVAGTVTAVTTGQLAARTALYPNPTAGRATLELAGLREQGAVRVEVVNVLGQTVQQLSTRPKQGFLTETLNLSGLPVGVYTVRIHAQEGTVVKRLVKE